MHMSDTLMELNRVRMNTPPDLLRKIDEQTERNIHYYSTQPWEAISRRITELQEEWSIERWLELQVSAIGLGSVVLAILGPKRWALVTCAITGMLLAHGLKGSYPALPILRKLGMRTRGEIDREMFALKAMRGDFADIPGDIDTTEVRHAAERAASAVSQS